MSGSSPLASRRAVLGIGSALSLGEATGAVPTIVQLGDFLDAARRAAADRGDVVDCTDAFARALSSGRHVTVPPGHYGLTGLRLPNGSAILGGGGVVLHQIDLARPVIHCLSDAMSGQLADVIIQDVELRGHAASRAALLRLEARGGYAIWRSRFSVVARNAFRALEVEALDANNVFACEITVVAEGMASTAALVRGGVYNRYRLFLTRTLDWALDDQSSGSDIHVVAENSVIFRGQTNQVTAKVEGITASRAADESAITDRGFGNTFTNAEVSMPPADAGKLRYAFQAFQGSVFVNPQILGAGAPPHPFAPTSNFPFTVIGGRSAARHKVEATFDGSDPDHDPRNITFVGDVRDYTALVTRPGAVNVQRFAVAGDAVLQVAATTQVAVLEASPQVGGVVLDPGPLRPPDGWVLEVVAAGGTITRLRWPAGSRFEGLPDRLTAGGRLRLIYQAVPDRWLAL